MIALNLGIAGRRYGDVDVEAFISATGITDMTIISALNVLVLDLKANNLWSRLKAIYPMIGGTAFTHKFNLKNPTDSDIAFRLNFGSVWVHSSNGALPNGTTSYANTFFVPSTELSTSSGHLFFYSRTNSAIQGYDIGSSDDNGVVSKTVSLIARYFTNLAYATYGNGGYVVNVSVSDGRGGFMCNRNDVTNTTLWRNGIIIKTSAETVSLTSQPLYISAVNAGGGANYFSNKECSFASIGGGFSDSEALLYYNIIQEFQTTLGRQV